MDKKQGKFTFKIVLSYLILATLALAVGTFIFYEIKEYVSTETANENDDKLLRTNTLLTNLYEAESLSKLSLQDNTKQNFDAYEQKIDSVQSEIDALKLLSDNDYQKGLLDSLKILLEEKVTNNNALRNLKLKNSSNSSIDKALKEFDKIDESLGKFTAENLFSNFDQLSPQIQNSLRKYARLLSENTPVNADGSANKAYIDSILTVSKTMLKEAKLKESQSQRSLAQKEIEVTRHDLELSRQLQTIIATFEQEVVANTYNNNIKRRSTLKRTTRIAGFAALLGFLIVGLFSFLITRDYWKVQTYRDKLEKEKKFSDSLLKSREQLISTVSHDLRTPLNTISGYSELLENTELTSKQLGYIKNVKSASGYVGNLVNDLLDFSKLDAGKLHIEHVPFIAAHLIQETAENLQALYSAKKLKLYLDIAPELQKTTLGDPFRIRQILTNLIGNAFKFTEDGFIRITAKGKINKGKALQLRIDVTDTGIGIPKEKQKLVFDEFTQADSDTEKKFGGYGLGLTISKKLAELLRGTLVVESEVGKGSTFTLTLPLTISHVTIKETEKEAPYMVKKLRMLIIDDDTALLQMLKELAESMGIVVHTFTNFLQVEHDSHLDYDLVLTDIQMPQITGFEVLNRLQSGKYNHYKKQPIIAMTGRRDLEAEAYTSIGFSQVLQKPFSKGELIAVLKLLGILTKEDPDNAKPSHQVNHESDIYNLDIIHSFLGTNEDAIYDVLQTFLRDTRTNMKLLEEGVSKADYEHVNQVAHRMLPMFRQLKVEKSIGVLETMELAKSNTLEEAQLKILFEKLQKNIELLVAALATRLTTSPSYSD